MKIQEAISSLKKGYILAVEYGIAFKIKRTSISYKINGTQYKKRLADYLSQDRVFNHEVFKNELSLDLQHLQDCLNDHILKLEEQNDNQRT